MQTKLIEIYTVANAKRESLWFHKYLCNVQIDLSGSDHPRILN
jgi:hypothetical protein